MYTHSLDRSPELEKLFNLYTKKSEVSILYVLVIHITVGVGYLCNITRVQGKAKDDKDHMVFSLFCS